MTAISVESLTFKDFVSKGQFEVYKSTLPADHLATTAVEIMQRIRDAGVDHDKWLKDLKVASGWQEDPLKLLHAIVGYESCCRYTINVQTGEFKAKKETELAVSDEMKARIKSFLELRWTTFENPRSSAEIAKPGMAVARLQPSTASPSESLLRSSRILRSQKTPNSCSRQWGRWPFSTISSGSSFGKATN